MYSIGQFIEEYLVNFEYFTEKLREHNIDVVNTEDMEDMMLLEIKSHKSSVGSFGDVFNNLNLSSQKPEYREEHSLKPCFIKI